LAENVERPTPNVQRRIAELCTGRSVARGLVGVAAGAAVTTERLAEG